MRGQREVDLYEKAMLRELQANHYKGGWDAMTRRDHFRELNYHNAKLKAAIRAGDTLRVLEYAADLGNHAWMAAEFAGALTPVTIWRRRAETSFAKAGWGVYARLMLTPRWFFKGLAGWRHRRDYEQHPEPTLEALDG